MLRLAVRGLFARKLRTLLTGFAVVIGVAFVTGTFVYTDTIDASFKDLFERVSKGVDVNVTGKNAVDADFGGRPQPLPAGTLDKVKATDGVAAAEGNLSANVSIFDKQGKRVGGQSARPCSSRGARSASTRSPTRRAAARRSPARSPSTRRPPRTRASSSATPSSSPAGSPRGATRSSASPSSATRSRSGWPRS